MKRRVDCPGCARSYAVDERAPLSTPFRCGFCGARATLAALLLARQAAAPAPAPPPAPPPRPLDLSVEVLPDSGDPDWGEESFELEVPPSGDQLVPVPPPVPPTIDPDARRRIPPTIDPGRPPPASRGPGPNVASASDIEILANSANAPLAPRGVERVVVAPAAPPPRRGPRGGGLWSGALAIAGASLLTWVLYRAVQAELEGPPPSLPVRRRPASDAGR